MKKYYLSLLIIWFAVTNSVAQNFWQSTNNLNGSVVSALTVRNNGWVFAGCSDEIFRSTDKGNSWLRVCKATADINCFGYDGTSYLYAGLSNGGVIVSHTDVTWQSAGLAGKNVFDIVVTGNGNVFAGVVSSTHDGGIYKSTDEGQTWTVTYSGNNVYCMAVDKNNNIYAGYISGTILKSTDYGKNWQSLTVTSKINSIIGLNIDLNGNIFALQLDQCYKSSDSGKSWKSVLSGVNAFSTYPFVVSSNTNANNYLFLGTSNEGVLLSTDSGDTWKAINSGLQSSTCYSLTMSNSDGYIYAGVSSWCDKGSLNPLVPAPPTLITPSSGSSITSSPSLVWNASKNATGYDLQIATDQNFYNIVVDQTGISDTSYQTQFGANTYYWRVSATNSNGTSSYSAAWSFTIIPATGLVAYYPFNGNANDESGNGYNGIVNGATLVADRFNIPNRAYSFNGSTNYIEIANSNTLHLKPGSFTIAVWVNFTDYNEDNCLVFKHLYGYRTGWGIGIYQQHARFLVDSGYTYNGIATTESYGDGHWHFLVGKFDGIKQTLYVDGIPKISQNSAYILTNNSDICIGNSVKNGGGYAGYFKGKIDDVSLYNRVLTDLEIQQLYHEGGWNPSSISTQGLVAYYPFDGIPNDASGNGNNGIVNGATLTIDRFGNSNQAYSFNGTDNYIAVNQNSTLELGSGDFTVSAWIKTSSPNFARVVSKGECFSSGWQIGQDGKIEVSIQSPPNGPLYMHSNLNNYSDGHWHFILFKRENGSIQIYGDGVKDGNPLSFPYSLTNTNARLTIGRCDASGGACDDAFFNGAIDDIRIYTRALSETEIQQLYLENGWGSSTQVVKLNNTIDGHFEVYQNYPNPFNPSTTINYSIAASGHVSIKVYDMLGREIATLIDEEKSSGNYTCKFNGVNMPSGVYFYRIKAGNFSSTKKLVLLK